VDNVNNATGSDADDYHVKIANASLDKVTVQTGNPLTTVSGTPATGMPITLRWAGGTVDNGKNLTTKIEIKGDKEIKVTDAFWTNDTGKIGAAAKPAFKLDKGQVSDPVKTQFGWHIIKVEDKRTKPVPEFDKVKDQVETYVVRKAQADYIHKLQESAKIERLDKK
jgi:hypothetical protein